MMKSHTGLPRGSTFSAQNEAVVATGKGNTLAKSRATAAALKKKVVG